MHLNIASLPKHFEDLENYISLLKQSFDIILDPVLEEIDKERKTCLLMGDFNINLLNIESDKLVSNFYDLMTSRCFAPFIAMEGWLQYQPVLPKNLKR